MNIEEAWSDKLMKRVWLIIGFIVPIMVPFIIWYLETEKADIVYSISDNIPVSDADNADINTQQIEIKNLGSLTAKDVQLKIDANISNYRVINDSASDKVDIFDKNAFELIYSELPPDGQFTLVIESDIKGLDEKILIIKSDEGIARNVLENERNSNKIGIIIFGVISFVYLFFAVNALKSSYAYLKLKNTLLYSMTERMDFIYSKKPIYIKDTDWEKLLNSFIQLKIDEDLSRDYTSEVNSLNTLKILLNKDKPRYLSDDTWNKLRKKAAEVFTIKIKQSILGSNSIPTDPSIITFFTGVLEAIEQLSDSLKREIGIFISKEYINYKAKKKYIRLEDVNNNLAETKPSFVSQSDWNTYLELLAEIQYMLILQEMFRSYNDPLEILNRYQDIIVKHSEEIKGIAYSIKFYKYIWDILIVKGDYEFIEKPDWLKESDIRELERITNLIVKSKVDIEFANKKTSLMNQLILSEELVEEERPEYLNEREWGQVITLNDKFKKLNEFETTYQNRREALQKEEEETSKLIEKVRFQLTTIHNLLQDPSTIDRIESYETYFAKGNYLNLVKLAAYLKELK
ncbi:hypothetical protein [Niallia taxi]|uniref:hypothetical protein n=1 Tax=Niallia taxi TaxID=2499688 RepID=UPI002E222DEE|nr:hypothetical protein [Niallia taxi]